ncbi:FAD-dependent oxidoreductase [Candidatus Sumerlaeota bacterium]|nr:FAD-dependent oxidoreductase [Candidatus Sumerlaeota bacterium]
MTEILASAWRCSGCGYVHRGPEPPNVCPVCGAPKEAFQPFEEPKPAPAQAAPRIERFVCSVCGHVHEGGEPPEHCPVCGAARHMFQPAPTAATPQLAGAKGIDRLLIVGAGIAGIAAAEAAHDVSPSTRIALVSREAGLPYYRLNLTRYLAGEIEADSLPMHPAAWCEERGIRLLAGIGVEKIDPEARTATLSDGSVESFDRLILACGSHAFMPPFPGAEKKGVGVLRTIDDTEAVLEAIRRGDECVCIGGGILGLETAGAIARRVGRATLLESHGWLMPRQLNRRGGEILARTVKEMGIDLRSGVEVGEIVGAERVEGVRLVSGETIAAGRVVVTAGVRSNTFLAREAKLEVDRGVVVDNRLRASHEAVYAAGDAAEHNGVVYGIWPASQYQGTIAGMNAAGGSAEFGGLARTNTLKVLGIDLASVGEIEAADGSDRVIEQESAGRYFRFLFRDNCLRGAILLGDIGATAPATHAIENRTDLSALLASRPAAAEVAEHLSSRGG